MAIIGVVGASGDGYPDLWPLAASVGRAVVVARHVLLTGGGGSNPKPNRVRDCAVVAALEIPGAKIISILPKSETGAPTSTHLPITTPLSSDGRNVINGFTPDGLIALHGSGGTLSEVAYALYKKKPVVFLDSRDALRASRHELSGKLIAGYAAFRHLLPNPEDLIASVEKVLADSSRDVHSASEAIAMLEPLMTPNRAADYPDCPDAVRKALDALLG